MTGVIQVFILMYDKIEEKKSFLFIQFILVHIFVVGLNDNDFCLEYYSIFAWIQCVITVWLEHSCYSIITSEGIKLNTKWKRLENKKTNFLGDSNTD